ncbi:AarF/ABC1/UbiB kinase family protein [Altererythrobacter xixiisoli]|uniref:AarF/ABC1/UbiB kinase family protein n=1 Tax=Croceibacterium xixiisoli TaxID=1476466 RepID=A0A6I4TU64_9SPHN|nr:AarF/UbiB family protein [Croceibacterium xixiisoli]MXO98740.1 AarF/ABC1/UbiB kinase family protein [Croceibacterium xixiisoli]
MIDRLVIAKRDQARFREILAIATRFGLGLLLARVGLQPRADDQDDDPRSLPHRTRLALEELGPTFVKLGQILATRSDLLPPEWIAELEHLQSSAPTLPFDMLRPQVEQALGQSVEDAFAHFDPQPLAAASMAQVHRATLHGGQDVVLKIRRPGIRPQMEADLRLIAQLAGLIERASAEARRFAPQALLRQLASAVLEELDFTGEGRNADRLRDDFALQPRVVVPEIHWALSSETLLVMGFIAGIPPRDPAVLHAAGIDPAEIAAVSADAMLEMVLINGRFHADPHPGNLLCLPGNGVALLDLGMIGHVSPRRQEEFIAFIQSLTRRDPALLTDTLMQWSAGSGVPKAQVQASADRLIARHGQGTLVLSAMVADFMQLMREEGMTMPPDLLLVFKALITVDGVMNGIVPGFDLSEAMRRSSRRLIAARLDPAYWQPLLQSLAWELGRVGDDAPRLIRAAVRRLEQEPAPAADTTAAIRAASLKMSGAVLIGCMIIAGAVIWG